MVPPKYSSKRGLVNGSSAQGLIKFSIRAAPLPKSLLEFILDNVPILKRLQRERRNAPGGSVEDEGQDREDDDDADRERSYDDSGEMFRKPTVRPEQFWTALEEVCKKAGGDWDKGIVDRIWAFGPHKAGGCLLVDARKNIKTLNSYALSFLQLIVLTIFPQVAEEARSNENGRYFVGGVEDQRGRCCGTRSRFRPPRRDWIPISHFPRTSVFRTRGRNRLLPRIA